MSHKRAEKKYPFDKYTKESNGIALFLLQIGWISNNEQLMICGKENKIFKDFLNFSQTNFFLNCF